MAPLVGALADKSKSRWGRRRPFMVGGSVVVAMCLLTLGWAKEIVQSLIGSTAFVSQASEASPVRINVFYEKAASATIWLAVLSIYALDFAINAGMKGRASTNVSTADMIHSTMVVSKSNYRYSASAEAADWFSLGHVR